MGLYDISLTEVTQLMSQILTESEFNSFESTVTADGTACQYVAHESLLPYLAQQIHNLGHSGPATMNHRFSNQWWSPKFRNVATETVKGCIMSKKI